MGRKAMSYGLLIVLVLTLGAWAQAAEKLKLGTATKECAIFYLPIFAGEEKGLWKKNGLEVEWVPFKDTVTLLRAMSGGAINIGWMPGIGGIVAISAGAPVIAVSDLWPGSAFFVWVKGDSPIREQKQLGGTKMGILRLGTASHAYALIIAKKLGLEREMRFIGTGGTVESMAALEAGAVDAIVMTVTVAIKAKLEGKVRDLMDMDDQLPKKWLDHSTVIARKDFAKNSPETIRRSVRASLEAIDFIRGNRSWSMEKMKKESGYPEEAARFIYDLMLKGFTRSGKIEREAAENVRNFVIEYNLAPREKVPPLEEIYTTQFTG